MTETSPTGYRSLAQLIHDGCAAGSGALTLISSHESRCIAAIQEAANMFPKPVPVRVWDAVGGWHNENLGADGTDPVKAMLWILSRKGPGIYVVRDLPWYWDNDPRLWRLVLELRESLGRQKGAIVTIQREPIYPAPLQGLFAVIDEPLPGRDEIMQVFSKVAVKNPTAEKLAAMEGLKRRMVDAALGLSLEDAEHALNKALASGGKFADAIIQAIYDEKRRLVGRTGILEFLDPHGSTSHVGGMAILKDWLGKRAHSFSQENLDAGVTPPRGVLIMGISGCGKSLFVKAISGELGLPLLRLDMASVYGAAGTPEGNLRSAFKTAEALAPCILWIDEMEAGISVAGQKAEGGSQSRVLSYFLTWMQEKTLPVFVAATANAIDLLPAEVLRKGRFDEIFYVGLPSLKERGEILAIHLKRRKKNPTEYDLNFLASSAKGFSGAELEQAVASAILEADADKIPLSNDILTRCITRTVPMSVTMSEQIKKIQDWAARRAKSASAEKEP